jgi:fatty-acyl-CoA synthase
MGIDPAKARWHAESDGWELENITIGALLDRQAEAFPENEALVYNYPELGINLRLSFRRYRDEVQRVARGLLALGIEKGEHVAVWATNLPEWVLLELALAKIGAVLVTINTNYRASELDYVLRQGDCTTLFLIEECRGNSFLESVQSIAPPRLRRVILMGAAARAPVTTYAEVVALGESVPEAALERRQASVGPGDVAQIQYTSGTTGFPKGAMLTHQGLVNNARFFTGRARLGPRDRYISAMPLFHTAGCVLAVLGSLSRGCALIQLIAFDPAKQLELIAAERATFSLCVPTMLIAMLNHPRFQAGEFDTSSLRQVASGGAPVPVVVMEQVRRQMGADTWVAYGLTESSPLITQAIPTDSFELKAATVGRPLPHTEVKIVDPGSGGPAAFGEPGELRARGYLVMPGYYNMPERTAEAIDSDGWLHTGDLATMDSEGYVRIVGRLKDMIIRGGENVYPAEIEAFMMRHPKIAEAQVVGVPDRFMGEEIAAVLRVKSGESAGEAEILAYCRAGIGKHKMPKYVRFVTEFPLTASGKVKKLDLRKQLAAELGLDAGAAPSS